MTEVYDFDDAISENTVNDAIGISRCQECSITLESVEHCWTHFGKITEQFQLAENLILDGRGESRQFLLSSWEQLNASCHVVLVSP